MSAIAAAAIFTAPIANAASFSDITDSETYKKGIEFLAAEGIINGYPDGTYKPLQTLNRAEMLKIVAISAQKYFNWPQNIFDSYNSHSCFSDIPANQWFTKYVCYAKDKGWVVGYENGKYFRPAQTVSLVEGLKMALQAFNIEYEKNAESDTNTADTITSPWYKSIVEKASENNYIPHQIYSFNADFKRNEMADLIARILKAKQGLLDEYLGDRADIVVTYESIEAGQNLLELEIEEICPENIDCQR